MKVCHLIKGDSISGSTGYAACENAGFPEEFKSDISATLTGADKDRGKIDANVRIKSPLKENAPSVNIYEFQTWGFGKPYIAVSMKYKSESASIRNHGFTDYAVFPEIAPGAFDAEKLIKCSAIPGNMISSEDYIKCKDLKSFQLTDKNESWNVESSGGYDSEIEKPDEEFTQALLYRYWENASRRMFVDYVDSPVCFSFGRINSEQSYCADIELRKSGDVTEEARIVGELGREYFAQVILKGLPPQVKNIASMSCAVPVSDSRLDLNSALQFTTYGDNDSGVTFVKGGYVPDGMALEPFQREFMGLVSQGKIPETLEAAFEAYQKKNKEATPENTPFMADLFVWEECYRLDRFLKAEDKQRACSEVGSKDPCVFVIREIRLINKYIKSDGTEEEYMDDIMNAVESQKIANFKEGNSDIYDFISDQMSSGSAVAFMKEGDIKYLHRRIVRSAPEGMWQRILELVVKDQDMRMASDKMPNALDSIAGANVSNAVPSRQAEEVKELLSLTLPVIIKRSIEEKNEDAKGILLDMAEDGTPISAWLGKNNEIKKAAADVVREQIGDVRVHCMLHSNKIRLSDKYVPEDELAKNTFILLEKFINENEIEAIRPGWVAVAQQDCQRNLESCRNERDSFYKACFTKYVRTKNKLESFRELLEKLGNDNDSAIGLIIRSEENDSDVTGELLSQVTYVFGKPGEIGRKAFAKLVECQCEKNLDERNFPLIMIKGLLQADGFTINPEPLLVKIFEAGKETQWNYQDIKDLLTEIPCHSYASVKESFANMVDAQCEKMIAGNNVDWQWVNEVVRATNGKFTFQTSGIIKKLLEFSKKEQLDINQIGDLLGTFIPAALSENDKKQIQAQFGEMLKCRFDEQIQGKDFSPEWISGAVAQATSHGIQVVTTEYLKAIFEKASKGEALEPDEAEKILRNLAGPNKQYTQNKIVQDAYSSMISAQQAKMIAEGDQSVQWIAEMAKAAEGFMNVNTSANLLQILENMNSKGEELTEEAAKSMFSTLGKNSTSDTKIRKEYKEMLKNHIDNTIREGQFSMDSLDWIMGMMEVSGMELDTTEFIQKFFENAADPYEMNSDRARQIFDTLGGKDYSYALKKSVVDAYSEMLERLEEKLIEENSGNVSDWLKKMIDCSPYESRIDTRRYVESFLKAALPKENSTKGQQRISESDIAQVMNMLPKDSTVGMGNVKAAIENLKKAYVSEAAKEKDISIFTWLGAVYGAAGENLRLDMTSDLIQMFDALDTPDKLTPIMARQAMKVLREERKGEVRRKYAEMLAKWRENALETREAGSFSIITEMSDSVPPFSYDETWLTSQHDEQCELLRKMDSADLMHAVIKRVDEWIKSGKLTEKGKFSLQQYCNAHCSEQNPDRETIENLYPKFASIDGRNSNLVEYGKKQVQTEFTKQLRNNDKPLSEILEGIRGSREKLSYSLDSLYSDTKEKSEKFISDYVGSRTDIGMLKEEMNALPNPCGFATYFRETLENSLATDQENRFNSLTSIEEADALRKNMEGVCSMNESLKAAYGLLEYYEGLYDELCAADEANIEEATRKCLNKVRLSLDNAGNVSAKAAELCAMLKPTGAGNALKTKGYKWTISGNMVKKMVDPSFGWDRAIENAMKSAKPKNEYDQREIVRKPYAKENLPVLQMAAASIKYVTSVQALIGGNTIITAMEKELAGSDFFRKYSSALRKNKKQTEKYGIEFNGNGIITLTETIKYMSSQNSGASQEEEK